MDFLLDFEFWKVAIPAVVAAVTFGFALWKAYKERGLRGLIDAFIDAGESEELRGTLKFWTEINFDPATRKKLDAALKRRGLFGQSKKGDEK